MKFLSLFQKFIYAFSFSKVICIKKEGVDTDFCIHFLDSSSLHKSLEGLNKSFPIAPVQLYN